MKNMDKNQSNLLLEYIINALDEFDDEEREYMKVTEIANVITSILGTEKAITGKMINQILVKEGFQEPIEDDELFKFKPTRKFRKYKKVVNEERGYGIITWHFSVIAVILDFYFSKSLEENVTRILSKIKKYGIIFSSYSVDEVTLKEALEEIGIE